MNQSVLLCIGISESKHIGKNVRPMPQEVIIKLSGLLSEIEREKLIHYFTMQLKTSKNKYEIEHVLELLENNNDSAVIKWSIDHKIDLVSILNTSYLRHKMIYFGKQFSPWFLREVALLPVVCGCLKNCLINPNICQNITYLIFLIDQLERNHHHIETENDHEMLTDALIIINNQLQALYKDSSHIHKRLIEQAIEKLILIQKIHDLIYYKNHKKP